MIKKLALIFIIFLLSLTILSKDRDKISFAYIPNNGSLKFIFFEEFPTDENLARAGQMNFPIDIFIAAKSIEEFKEIKEKLNQFSNVKRVGYWPTLKLDEGYWFSPFSKREGILRTIRQLESVDWPISVLWDSELPHLRKRLFLTELSKFFANRKIIQDFVLNPPENITLYIAENRAKGRFHRLLLRILGVTFDPRLNYRRVEMLYGQLKPGALERFLAKAEKEYKNYYPAFGITAGGISESVTDGSWMKITPQQLDEQLSIAKKMGIKKVFIYRLGGMNQDYLDVIKKYAILGDKGDYD